MLGALAGLVVPACALAWSRTAVVAIPDHSLTFIQICDAAKVVLIVTVELDPFVMPYQISTFELMVELLARLHVATPPPVGGLRGPLTIAPTIISRLLFTGVEVSVSERVVLLLL